MILVEKRLKEIFDTLPAISSNGKTYTATYGFGTKEDLNKELKLFRDKGGAYYPLIWLITPITKTGKKRINFSCELLLAENALNKNQSNLSRLETHFQYTLVPLYKNVIHAFHTSGFTKIVDKKRIERTDYFNYTDSTDIWDAIKLKLTLEMDGCPLKTIHY